jgi:hypothetical protein
LPGALFFGNNAEVVLSMIPEKRPGCQWHRGHIDAPHMNIRNLVPLLAAANHGKAKAICGLAPTFSAAFQGAPDLV